MDYFDILPDSIILKVLFYLNPIDVVKLGATCKRLKCISEDELLWKYLFQLYFRSKPMLQPLVCSTWKEEFVRLVDETPLVEVEVLRYHTDQVLHVSFSHDGHWFATTSKDGFVHLWKATHPVKLAHSRNMKDFSWKYTQFSQFNESDTLLLVSGVLFGLHSTGGEIAIFSVDDGFQLQCRTPSKPYDVFGTWYSDMFFFSGDLRWLGNMVSKSVIWINKASQETESERKSVMEEMYRFYNPKSSSVRSIMIANCTDTATESDINVGKEPSAGPSSNSRNMFGSSPGRNNNNNNYGTRTGNPPSNLCYERDLHLVYPFANHYPNRSSREEGSLYWRQADNVADINYTEEFRANSQRKTDTGPEPVGGEKKVKRQGSNSSDECETGESYSRASRSSSSEVSSPIEGGSREGSPCKKNSKPKKFDEGRSSSSCSGEILDPREKWLIFTCGSKTFTPHQIGFKKIKPMTFNEKIDTGPSLQERIEEHNRRQRAERNGDFQHSALDWSDFEKVSSHFDKIDHILELHGHIIGMTLSPDHRYLYVNSRPWPENYKIEDPLNPPPIAQEIDIHVIDMTTLKEVGMMRRAHRAYTPNEECFFIFLDACDFYLASGAENKAGYLWDRNYGISLAELPHTDVVNCVAFNPVNSEMLVTVSDDIFIKVWRSKRQSRQLGLDLKSLNQGGRLFEKNITLFPKQCGSGTSAST